MKSNASLIGGKRSAPPRGADKMSNAANFSKRQNACPAAGQGFGQNY